MIKTGMLGNRAEKLAAKYLQQRKLTLIETNYRCKLGELDLVMWDQDYLVFVEVRYRKSQGFGGALESIDRHKQAKLLKAAQHYLITRNQNEPPARFDIICMTGQLSKPQYQWIKNAF